MKFEEYKQKAFAENPEVKEEYDKMKNLEIIDVERKGNVVRFYLGKNGEQWGDDWDDAPYEYNAGSVYSNFEIGHKDVAFPFDDLVLEPCSGTHNSSYSKKDMMLRKVPCLIVVPKEVYGDDWSYLDSFSYWVGADGVKKYYFGDYMEVD